MFPFQLAPKPETICYSTPYLLGSRLYFLGGVDRPNGKSLSKKVEYFDLDTETWGENPIEPKMPVAAKSTATVVFEEEIWVRELRSGAKRGREIR